MARGNEIVVSTPEKGHRETVIISGTPLPGTLMELVPNTAPVGGIYTWRARTGSDGARGPIAVLDYDKWQGKTAADAYESGKSGSVYFPANGEELNVRYRFSSGTGTQDADDYGDPLEVDGATGWVQGVETGGPTDAHASAPFRLRETLDATISGTSTLVHVQYLANG